MAASLLGSIDVFTSLGHGTRTGITDTASAAVRFGFDTLWLADVRGDLSFFDHAWHQPVHSWSPPQF